MPGPLLRPVRRALGKGALLATAAVVVLASAARSAEVAIAEIEGEANHVVVEQGGSTSFTLEVRATGWIRCSSSATNPATAAFNDEIRIELDGSMTTSSSLASASFYAEPNGGTLCRVTWAGDPVPQRLRLTVTADIDAPLGEHAYWPRAVLTTPPGSGDRLEDRTRTMLRFTVVPGSDRVPPDVMCDGPRGDLGRNGWYVSAVSHDCTAADSGSGLADAADASFTLATEGEGVVHTPHKLVGDRAGNATQAGPFGPYRVDLEDPSLFVTVPAADAVFVLGQAVDADVACVDGVSGIAECGSDRIDTSTVGTKRFNARASDEAGRERAVWRTYSVVYDFSWSRAPTRSARAGSAIPVAWSLAGVAEPGSFVAADAVPCGGGANEPVATLNGPVYSGGNDRYQVVLKTDAGWASSCRVLRLHLDDGSAHGFEVWFS